MKKLFAVILVSCFLAGCPESKTPVRDRSLKLMAKPRFKPGDWVQPKLTGRCGVVHDRQDWLAQDWYEYRVRFAEADSRWRDYSESVWAEGELDWCSK